MLSVVRNLPIPDTTRMVVGSCVIDGHCSHGAVTSRLTDQAFTVSAQLAATKQIRALAAFIGAPLQRRSEGEEASQEQIGDHSSPELSRISQAVVNPFHKSTTRHISLCEKCKAFKTTGNLAAAWDSLDLHSVSHHPLLLDYAVA